MGMFTQDAPAPFVLYHAAYGGQRPRKKKPLWHFFAQFFLLAIWTQLGVSFRLH